MADLEPLSQSDDASGADAGQTASPRTAEMTAVSDTNLIDLDQIAADLADVEVALARLDSGTYWTDEVTGEPLSDELMTAHPLTRQVAQA